MAAFSNELPHAGATAASPSPGGEPAREAFRALGRQASAGLESAANNLRDRVGTLMEGQRILQSGGAAAERALLAKRAAAEAAAADADARRSAPEALAKIEGAAQALWHAAGADPAPASELRELAEVYAERARTLRLATGSLGEGAPVAPELTAAEQDAVSLVQTRAALASGLDLACQAVKAKTAEGATALGQASQKLTEGCAGDVRCAPGAERHAAPGTVRAQTMEDMKELLQDKAHTHLRSTVQAVNERVGIARQGSQLLSDGGERAVQALLAKKAAADAAACDADVVLKVAAAAAAYLASAAAERAACATAEAEVQQQRADCYSLFAAGLAQPVAPPAWSDAEQDALRITQVRESLREAGRSVALQVARSAEFGLGALQDGTTRGTEALRAWAAAPDSGAHMGAGGSRLSKNPCM